MTPFSEMLDKIAPHFDSWEIIAEGMHTMSDIEDDIRKVQESSDIHFQVHAPFSDINMASLNQKIRESSIAQTKDAMRICADLDIKLVTIHPGYRSPLGAYFGDEIRETNKNSIKEIGRAGEEFGVILALENIPRMWISLCSTASELMELLDGTNLKICFDVGHANISDDITGFLDIKDNFANVHIHDNFGDRDRHLILGEGNIDLSKVLRELSDYNGNYVIESNNLEEGIKSKDFLENMLKGNSF